MLSVASVYQGDAWLDFPILEPDPPVQAVEPDGTERLRRLSFAGLQRDMVLVKRPTLEYVLRT